MKVKGKEDKTICYKNDLAIMTAPEKQTEKIIDKLKTVAGRVLNK